MATIDMTSTRRGAVAAAQPESSLHVAGGIAALLQGLAVIGSGVLFQVVSPAMGFNDSYWDEPSKAIPFVVAHQGYFYLTGLFLIVSALIVPPVVLALHARLRARSPGLISAATFFGALGAVMLLLNGTGQYAEFHVFSSVSTTVAQQAEPYGNIAFEATFDAAGVCLGLWTLLVSWAVITRGGLPRWLGYFGVLVGIAYSLVLVTLPIGGLLSVPWLIGVGIALLRSPSVVGESELQTAG